MLIKSNKILSLILIFLLLFEQSGFAQVETQNFVSLHLSAHLTSFHNTLPSDKYRPLHLRYLGYDANNGNFKLLLDKGDFLKEVGSPALRDPAFYHISEERDSQETVVSEKESCLQTTGYCLLKQETNKLMEYFFIGLTLPNESFWVNLRPDSPDNIIDNELAKTDIGKILLEADVQLKKDTALYTSPQTAEGKKYWDKLYKKAEELYGYDNITIPTLTRPWIVPGEIIIRETPDNAYIYKATLKVMLEEDYLKTGQSVSLRGAIATKQSIYGQISQSQIKIASPSARNDTLDPRLKELNTYSTQLIKELIIPKITKEVNTSRRYAKLRQVYYSLILAQWFKARFRSQMTETREQRTEKNEYIKLINSGNLTGVTSKISWSKDTYYQEYQKSFKYGEYNLKEPVHTAYGQTIRSYFSGGMNLAVTIPETPVSSGVVSLISGNEEINFLGTAKRKYAFMEYQNDEIDQVSSSMINKEQSVLTIPPGAYNAFGEIKFELTNLTFNDSSFTSIQLKDIKMTRGDQLSLPQYTNFLHGLWGKITGQPKAMRIEYAKGPVVYNPLGGFDPYVPFTLVEGATDVISVGLDEFGNMQDINMLINKLSILNYNDMFKDTDFIKLSNIFNYFSNYDKVGDGCKLLGGLKGAAIIRIRYLLDSEIQGLYYFRINENGYLNFFNKQDIINSSYANNAVVVFKDKEGKLKRYWYITQDINKKSIGFNRFIERLEFQTLLIKSALKIWDTKDMLARNNAINKILIPAKNNNVLVIMDQVYADDPNINSPHPVWNNLQPLFKIALSAEETFGYSNGKYSGYVYYGPASSLIGSVSEKYVSSPVGKINTQQISGSSKGGIDLCLLDMVKQKSSGNKLLEAGLSKRAGGVDNNDSEWLQIEKMVNAGIIPSSDRIEQCVSSCCLRDDFGGIREKAFSCMADVLKLEEDQGIPTEGSVKGLLALLESG